MKEYDKRKLKYQTKDNSDLIFKQIKDKVELYFASVKKGKKAQTILWVKTAVFSIIGILSYIGIFFSTSFIALVAIYLVLGISLLLLAINLGHDSAHHCITGNKKIDNLLFQAVFGLNGMSSYFWQIRHNSSHHIFPNVVEYDADLEITNLLLLHSSQTPKKWHKYQHIYASALYLLSSLLWIFLTDLTLFFRKNQANIRFKKIPFIEILKMVYVKVTYVLNFIVMPLILTDFSFLEIISAFVIMHLIGSVFLTYTFFISHHVDVVPYVEVNSETKTVEDSWVKHQIVTTIDFNPNSPVANFIFGGFNLHIAHHLFPEVCHTHYPEITRIIKTTLEENKLDWYKSFSFFEGVSSHIRHLKNTATALLQNGDENKDEMQEVVLKVQNNLN